MENTNNQNRNPNTNRNVWIGIIVVIIVILIIVLVNAANKPSVQTGTNTNTNNTTGTNGPGTNANEPASTYDTSATPGKTISGASSLSYTIAVERYTNKRLQFDKNCQASPNNVTYKSNTGIMIDNRSPQARTIKIGTTYTLKPYGFKIITLPDTYLKSKTLLVDCDKNQNVATVLVQP